MKAVVISFLLMLFIPISFSQTKKVIISGPRADNIELKNATIWLEVAPSVKNVAVLFTEKGSGRSKTIGYKEELGNDFNHVKIELNGLKINTTYNY